MSLWSFLGGFALFNAICDLFSSKKNRHDSIDNYPADSSHRDHGYRDYHDDDYDDHIFHPDSSGGHDWGGSSYSGYSGPSYDPIDDELDDDF